jgi:hypothetical protein
VSRWKLEAESLFQVLLKFCSPMGREEPGDSHPITDRWAVPGPVRVVLVAPELKCE